MLNIVICEDDVMQRSMVENYINEIIMLNSYDAKVYISTDSPEQIMDFISKNVNVNIYIIDVDLNSNITGMDIAKKIRETDGKSYIVFITGHYELGMMTFEYKIRALDYIIKGDNARIRDKLFECMSVIMNENKLDDENYFLAKTGSKYHKISYDDIMYFETLSGGHKILIHTTDGYIEFYSKLKDIINELNDDFYQCHKSYIVNIKNIKEINKDEQVFEMKNNERCYFSKRYKKELLDKCLNL